MGATGRELYGFFQMYASDSVDFMPMMVFMLFFYVNTFLYLKDFYRLIRKKDIAETLACLSLPLIVSVAGTMFLQLCCRVPPVGELRPFYEALNSLTLHVGLGLLAAGYFVLWGIWQFLQRKREKKDRRNWIRNCIPDFCSAAVICFGLFLRVFLGGNPFLPFPKIVLWLYLYIVEFLFCRVILLAVGLLVQIGSVRVPIKWREGTSAPLFLGVYYLFFQNAVFRNVGVFTLFCTVLPTVFLLLESINVRNILMSLFLWGCGAIILWLGGMKPFRGLSRFKRWGGKNAEELFCREYFLDPPVYRDRNVTITRHFLVDEQCPAAVYYWPAVTKTEGWHLTGKAPARMAAAGGIQRTITLPAAGQAGGLTARKGWIRTLYFVDGGQCSFGWEEKDSAEEVFAYARRWNERQEETEVYQGKLIYTREMVAARCVEEQRAETARFSRLQPWIMVAIFAVWFIVELLRQM